MSVDSSPHSDLVAAIEVGIRSTGDTNIGTTARYQARVALRSLEEQLEAQERDVTWAKGHIARLEREKTELREQYEVQRDKLVTLDAEYDRLKEQLEATQSALRAFVNAMESADLIHVEPSYMGFEVALSMADQALASSPATESVGDSGADTRGPSGEPDAGSVPASGFPERLEASIEHHAAILDKLAEGPSQDSAPAKKRDGRTSEEEMRDWNAHIEETWLTDDESSQASSPIKASEIRVTGAEGYVSTDSGAAGAATTAGFLSPQDAAPENSSPARRPFK